MNIILVPIGSHGDVHPFVGIGMALRARGHRVRVIVNPFFGPLVEQAGLELIPLGTTDFYKSMANNPELWKPIRGSKVVFQSIGELVPPVYEAIVANNMPGETAVVASTLALGARVAQDRHQIPTASVHLQPSIFRSHIAPPNLPGIFSGPRVPRWLLKAQWAFIDNVVIDRLACPSLNAFRKELGLPPVRGILRDYIHSPQRVIGMFPAWFAPPQADWPPQTRLTGFPLYDERGIAPLAPELVKFLEEGLPPIAFTFGSAMWHARELLEQSARACTLLGRRGILLTRHRDHLPPRLPAGVKHFDYAPFSELLPRCAALVHHGGIGTSSQGLAAGVPQVIVPHAHDQLDNATRVGKLGVGSMIKPSRYKSDLAAQTLGDLLGSESVAKACREVKGKFAGVDVMGEACGIIEEMLGGVKGWGERDVPVPGTSPEASALCYDEE
ncbi:MAG TPA: nucleotide disphospho-sugar-binding domain-containing protein [Tepidisphaeraceae bacterium]|nr:nucleotide disphospho-sugar-binding domain-containing protein [Tepidisphaeraceae bacterium]